MAVTSEYFRANLGLLDSDAAGMLDPWCQRTYEQHFIGRCPSGEYVLTASKVPIRKIRDPGGLRGTDLLWIYQAFPKPQIAPEKPREPFKNLKEMIISTFFLQI